MKTDDLISMLATGAAPVPAHVPTRRMGTALACGVLLAAAIMLLDYGVRADLLQAARDPMLWVKFAFPAALAATGFLVAMRLSLPGMRLGALPGTVLALLLALLLLGLVVLLNAPQEQRVALVLGKTWRSCSLSIAFLATPVFLAVLWAMQGLAPTRPALAGASAGLLAGACATFVYAFHCPEMAAPFIAVWYGLGMLIPAAVGALLGPRLLRW